MPKFELHTSDSYLSIFVKESAFAQCWFILRCLFLLTVYSDSITEWQFLPLWNAKSGRMQICHWSLFICNADFELGGFLLRAFILYILLVIWIIDTVYFDNGFVLSLYLEKVVFYNLIWGRCVTFVYFFSLVLTLHLEKQSAFYNPIWGRMCNIHPSPRKWDALYNTTWMRCYRSKYNNKIKFPCPINNKVTYTIH